MLNRRLMVMCLFLMVNMNGNKLWYVMNNGRFLAVSIVAHDDNVFSSFSAWFDDCRDAFLSDDDANLNLKFLKKFNLKKFTYVDLPVLTSISFPVTTVDCCTTFKITITAKNMVVRGRGNTALKEVFLLTVITMGVTMVKRFEDQN